MSTEELKKVTVTPEKVLTIFGSFKTDRKSSVILRNPLNKTLTFRVREPKTRKMNFSPRYGYIGPNGQTTIVVKARSLDEDDKAPDKVYLRIRFGAVSKIPPPKNARDLWKKEFGPNLTFRIKVKVQFKEKQEEESEKEDSSDSEDSSKSEKSD